MHNQPPRVQALLSGVARWASENPHISGVVLVGSCVSAEPAPESDVDLVIISESPDELLFDRTWIDGLGEAGDPAPEDWGKVQSLRARFADELEVEFGITGHEWLKQPIDGGTAKILRKGVVIVFDRAGYLEMALAEFKTLRFEGTIISDA